MIALFFKRREAASLKTTAARLSALSKSPEEEVRFEVAHNPNTPIEALFDLACEFPSRVLLNPIIPLLLLEDPSFFATAPAETLLALLSAHEVTQDVIDAVVHHKEKDTREFFARNKKTPEHVLARLARDPAVEVRAAVAKNEKTPLRLWLSLLGDEMPQANDEATRRLRNKHPELWQLFERLQEWPSATNRLSEQELSRFLVCGVGVLRKIVSYPWLSDSILEALANSSEVDIRFSVVMHPQSSRALLQKLSQDTAEQVSAYAHRRLSAR